jgi:trk system potassium uptake protein TrkA
MKKKFCVIGLGNFGFYVVAALYEAGHDIIAIDINKDKVQKVKEICSYALEGDAANKEFLKSQGLAEMDAVVISMGERSHISTLVTLHLKEIGVKRICVKAQNEDHGRILERVGADEIIFPEKDMARRIAHNLTNPNIMEYIPLAEEYSLSESEPPKHFIGKTLAELNLRRKYQLTVIAIKDVLTDEFIPAPPADHMIKDSDVLILIGKGDDLDKAMQSEK